MSSLGNKLDIYKKKPGKSLADKSDSKNTEQNILNNSDITQSPVSSAKNPVVAKSSSSGSSDNQSTLVFQDYQFQRYSNAFYICHLERGAVDVQMGKRTLAFHYPLDISAILELSSIPEPEAVHPEDILFLDTETTGLSRGVATIPFLIGISWIKHQKLITELLFIQNPAGEAAALDYLSDLWLRFRYMVSYNGKAFDIPLIRNRMIMHRRKGLSIGLHFDMLHIMRRLLVKGTVASYRQGDMEQFLLEHERESDLPGEQIPQIYFDYLKYGHDRGLAQVFKHNDWDLQGLTLLFLEAIQIYHARDEASDHLRSGLARILMRNKHEDQAVQLLAERLEQSSDKWHLPEDLRYRDRLLLAQLYRRRKNWHKSAQILRSIIADYNCPYAHLALAKLQEHHLRDIEGAMETCQNLYAQLYPQNFDRLSAEERAKLAYVMGRPPGQDGIYSRFELNYRLKRLQRKLNRL